MKVTECKRNIKCELGVCKSRATREIRFDRVGPSSRLHACDDCLKSLYSAIGEVLVPKSVETAKRKAREEKK